MINRLVDHLKSINNTIYNKILIVNSLYCATNFLLTLAEIDHILNQLWNGLRKLESDVSTIYNYTDFLSIKIVIPTLINPANLKTTLNNTQKGMPKYLKLTQWPKN